MCQTLTDLFSILGTLVCYWHFSFIVKFQEKKYTNLRYRFVVFTINFKCIGKKKIVCQLLCTQWQMLLLEHRLTPKDFEKYSICHFIKLYKSYIHILEFFVAYFYLLNPEINVLLNVFQLLEVLRTTCARVSWFVFQCKHKWKN